MKYILLVACLTISLTVSAQIIFDRNFASGPINHIAISNFAGDVRVNSVATDNVSITAELLKGSITQEVYLDFKDSLDYLLVYLRTPCTKPKSLISFDPTRSDQSNYWREDCSWLKEDEDHLPVISILVETPTQLNVQASTIMEGDIEINRIIGHIRASNVNGNIRLDQVKKINFAKTVNGNIDIVYEATPDVDGTFHTINGDIKINVDPRISATTSFKSFNGDFYTDIDSFTIMEGSKIRKSNHVGFKYQLDDRKTLSFNGGGTKMDLETFNGDVYLTAKE